MGHHHHGGGGRRGGRGWGGYPIIIEESWDDPRLFVGADKVIPLHLGSTPFVPVIPSVPAPLATVPDAGLAAAASPVNAVPASLATAPVAAKKSLIPASGALAVGVAGFAVGGPIGAAVGLAIGYFGGKAVSKVGTDVQQAIKTVQPQAPTVHGEFGCDHTAGWAPHGDERMR